MRFGRVILALWMSLSIGLPAAVFAAGPDQIWIKNGDRITGEIQEIWDKDIVIEPEYDDDTKISIPIAEVDYIESERKFDVVFPDRTEAVARLVGRDSEGRQLVEIDGEIRPMALAGIEELDEIAEYLDWESHIDLNGTVNRGNTDNLRIKFFADTNLKLGDHRHIASLTISRDEEDGARTKEQDLLKYNYNWIFSDPWFFGVTASAERDRIKDLESRLIVGTTAGRDLFNRARVFLSVQSGLGFLAEEDTFGDQQQSTIWIWALRYRQKFLKDLEFYHDDSINVYLTGRANTVYKTVTGMRYEITDLFYANTSLDFDYETQPAGTADNDDVTFFVGLGLEF